MKGRELGLYKQSNRFAERERQGLKKKRNICNDLHYFLLEKSIVAVSRRFHLFYLFLCITKTGGKCILWFLQFFSSWFFMSCTKHVFLDNFKKFVLLRLKFAVILVLSFKTVLSIFRNIEMKKNIIKLYNLSLSLFIYLFYFCLSYKWNPFPYSLSFSPLWLSVSLYV